MITPPLHPIGLPASLASVDRCLVMGVLNVTPDSFSDGGLWRDVPLAVAHGLAMIESGADLVDVGGESTRPGARRIALDDELARVMPVIEALVERGVVVSIDTMWAATAQAAVEAGASIVNDVSGGLADPAMLATVARLGTPYAAMHWRGHSERMQQLSHYDDVVSEVVAELADRRQSAIDAGIDPRALVLDPGLGFAKEPEHNWSLLHDLDRVIALGHPVLVGASRKRFLGELLAEGEVPRMMAGRDVATDAVSALAAAAGAWCVRVHDVAGSRDAVRVAAAWRRG